MIIDAFGYLGFWPFWNVQASTDHSLIEIMDRFGVDKTAICPMRSIFYDHEEGNLELSEALKGHPRRFIGIAAVNPHYENAVEEAEKCILDYKLKGLELQPNYHGYDLKSRLLDDIMKVVTDRGVPVRIPLRMSMNWNLPMNQVSDVTSLVGNYPDVSFIVGSFNYGEIDELMSLMNFAKNVMVETSGLQVMNGIERLVEEVGAEKVLFGSGMPIQSVGSALAKIKQADIEEKDKKTILRENAIRILKL